MITLYGVTEDGISVPVQVTPDGRIVAQGLDGIQGPAGPPGPDGPAGPPGEYSEGDDVILGTINSADIQAEAITANASLSSATRGLVAFANSSDATKGSILARNFEGNGVAVQCAGSTGATVSELLADGSASFALGKAGFNNGGELFITSRGTRWRVFVQNNMLMAEEAAMTADVKERYEPPKN